MSLSDTYLIVKYLIVKYLGILRYNMYTIAVKSLLAKFYVNTSCLKGIVVNFIQNTDNG